MLLSNIACMRIILFDLVYFVPILKPCFISGPGTLTGWKLMPTIHVKRVINFTFSKDLDLLELKITFTGHFHETIN